MSCAHFPSLLGNYCWPERWLLLQLYSLWLFLTSSVSFSVSLPHPHFPFCNIVSFCWIPGLSHIYTLSLTPWRSLALFSFNASITSIFDSSPGFQSSVFVMLSAWSAKGFPITWWTHWRASPCMFVHVKCTQSLVEINISKYFQWL